jgi:two-component system, cell cycle sensor histidine kinase and response regulator CckA
MAKSKSNSSAPKDDKHPPVQSDRLSSQSGQNLSSDQSELLEKERFLSEVFSCVRDGISVLDTDMTILRANSVLEEWHAYNMPIAGKKCYYAYHNRTSPCEICPTLRTLTTGQPDYAVIPKTGQDGKIVGWLDLYSFPFIDSKTKKLKGVIEYVRDITARKQAEDALRENEQKYRAIFENAPLTITLLDGDGRVLDINMQSAKMLGYPREDLIGKHFMDLPYLTKESKSKSLDALERRKHGELVEPYEVTYTTADGRRLVGHLHSVLLNDKNGRHVGTLVMVSDITRIKELQQQFHHAQKMESIGRLAGGIAHDFNNLLSAIMGFSELLLGDLHAEDPRRNEVNEIKKAAKRAGALTHQLLAFSRRQVIEFVALEFDSVVENMVKMLTRMIGEDIELEVAPGSEHSRVKADAGQLEQVIANLVVNARDAMPSGGKLKITTSNVTVHAKDIASMPEASPGEFICLSVSDTGVGIAPELIDQVFEPFFTTKNKEDGTGLGLATVYGIVKQHGGWVTVRSRVGKGTTFNVYVPTISAGADDKRDTDEASPSNRSDARYRVMLVEDDNELRKMMSRFLATKGHEVIAVASAEEARKVSDGDPAGIDLLIADVVLPGETGLDLAEYISKQRPKIRVLLCSGYLDEKSRHDLIKAKGFRFLQKPFSAPGMLKTVHEVMMG